MSIITFVNNKEEETGKTMSLVALATYMSIEYNNRILIISTTNKEDKIKSCFFEERQVKKIRRGIFGENTSAIDTESGIEGIAKIVRSNKLTPEMITNYTRVVFKDRLEILLGTENGQRISEEYADIINIASMYYDKVFVDLDFNVDEQTRNKILEKSDLVIVNSSQNYRSIKSLKENKEKSELLKSPKTLLLIGKYDKYSKYTIFSCYLHNFPFLAFFKIFIFCFVHLLQ